MIASALRFQIGARTIAAIPRRLERIAYGLDAVLAGAAPVLPPLPSAADGYLVTSMPEAMLPGVAGHGLVTRVRQRYTRYHVDLAAGEAAWRAGLSGQTRSMLKRKAKRLAQRSGGALDVRHYATPAALDAFHPLARAVSERTYQERLLDAGLPTGTGWARVRGLAAQDGVRAWLLFLDGAPIAYLCGTAAGGALRYDFVGHDPAFGDLSPGTVLMEAALVSLFGDKFRRFDFTEGEGQHKRSLASGGTACADVLMLRPTLANRAALAALGAFDAAVARGRGLARSPALRGLARRVRR